MATTLPGPRDPFTIALSMVVPMRHEFNRSVDVALLLKDTEYARSVLDLAATSTNQQLRERATFLEQRIFGPRAARPPAAPATAAEQSAATMSGQDFELEKAKAFKRYQGGLR